MRVTERFRLAAGQPRRLRIDRPVGSGKVQVFLDEAPVATLPLAQVEAAPVTVSTSAGELELWLHPDDVVTNWRLSLDGVPLPGAQNDPRTRLRFGAGTAILTGVVSAVMGAAFLAVAPGTAKARGLLVLGTLLALAGIRAWQRSRAAAWVATALTLPTGLAFVVLLGASPKALDLEAFIFPVILTVMVSAAVGGAAALEKQKGAPKLR